MIAQEIDEENPAAFAFWLHFWRRVIAALEILGGLYGLYRIVLFAEKSRMVSLLALALFVVVVWGGILLALNRRSGVTTSLVVQALQLFQVATAGFVYSFTCGIQFLVGLRQTENGTDLGFGLTWGGWISASPNPPPGMGLAGTITGLNLAAFLSIICLLYVRAEHRKAASPSGTSATRGGTQPAEIWPPAPKP